MTVVLGRRSRGPVDWESSSGFAPRCAEKLGFSEAVIERFAAKPRRAAEPRGLCELTEQQSCSAHRAAKPKTLRVGGRDIKVTTHTERLCRHDERKGFALPESLKDFGG